MKWKFFDFYFQKHFVSGQKKNSIAFVCSKYDFLHFQISEGRHNIGIFENRSWYGKKKNQQRHKDTYKDISETT